MQTLLEREDERGRYRIVFLREGSVEAQGEPGGIYADIARYDGTGYSVRCSSYEEACRRIFDEYGYAPYLRQAQRRDR